MAGYIYNEIPSTQLIGPVGGVQFEGGGGGRKRARMGERQKGCCRGKVWKGSLTQESDPFPE